MKKKDKEKILTQIQYLENGIEWLEEDLKKLKRHIKRTK